MPEDTIIYFYTGTGNSLWTAKKLSAKLNDAELVPIAKTEGRVRPDAEKIGLIFPVHIWGIPRRVVDFLSRLDADASKYYFALAVNAGQVAATLIQLNNLMKRKGAKLSAGFSICMPSNYIPWGGAIAPQKQQERFKAAEVKIDRVASSLMNREEKNPEKGPVWQNIVFSAIYRLSFSRVPRMDQSFRADEKCTSCGICCKICPSMNIVMTDGKPVWRHHCEQCFACLQWCPEEAIQYGKNTKTKKRYHHPEITLKNMLACVDQKTHQS